MKIRLGSTNRIFHYYLDCIDKVIHFPENDFHDDRPDKASSAICPYRSVSCDFYALPPDGIIESGIRIDLTDLKRVDVFPGHFPQILRKRENICFLKIPSAVYDHVQIGLRRRVASGIGTEENRGLRVILFQ